MLIPLIVTLSLFVQVCTAGLYDAAFTRLTNNQASQLSRYFSTAIFSNGDVLVGGFTRGLVGYNSAGGNDFLLQRYSEAGSLIWTKVYGDIGHDTIQGVTVDSSDNIFATGSVKATTGSTADAYVAKYDSAGNMIFSALVGGTAEDVGMVVCVDNANGVFYVTGYTLSPTFNGSPTPANNGPSSAFLLQLDSTSGAILRTSLHGVAGYTVNFGGLALDSTGALWVTGYANSPTYEGQTSQGSSDVIAQKFSPSGASLFAKLLGDPGNNYGTNIASDTSDNVYITGWTHTPVDGQPIIGNQDILVVKYNSAGTKLWTKIVGSAGYDAIGAMTVNSALGHIYITGHVSTAYFYNVPAPNTYTPFLLVLSTLDGSYVSSKLYPAGGGETAVTSIASRGPVLYIAGQTPYNFQGQTNTGGSNIQSGFVLKIGDGTLTPPTMIPSAAPTTVPTAAPTRVCMQWALGDYGESCSATCGKLSRTCKDKYLKDVVTQEAFYAVVGSAVNVHSGGYVGAAETFCSLTTESVVTVGTPAALSIVLSSEDHHSPVRTSCSYPVSAAEVTVGCDDVLPLHNYRRFCPCLDHNCDGAWYLGYSGDSCDATCNSAGGVCDAEPLSSIVNADAFSEMVASATVVETNEFIGESSATFCHEGINTLPLAPAPAVITLTFGAVNETLCAYPTGVSSLQGSCAAAFTDLPVQRFCNCKVMGPAPSQHRMLLSTPSATVTAPSATAPALGATESVTPRLRGKNKAAAPREV